jgi:hypothetical protein
MWAVSPRALRVRRACAVRRLVAVRQRGLAAAAAGASNPLLYGTVEPPLPPPEILTYGALSVEVVPNVGVGSVTYAGAEICRGINFLYRDEGWGTPPLALESSVIAKPEDRHSTQTVSWTSTVQLDGADVIAFDAQVAVGPAGGVAGGEPTLSVHVSADVLESCRTSRFGASISHTAPHAHLPPALISRRAGAVTRASACACAQVSSCSIHCAISSARRSMSSAKTAASTQRRSLSPFHLMRCVSSVKLSTV